MAHVADAPAERAVEAPRRGRPLAALMRFLRLPQGDFFAIAGLVIYIVFVLTALLADVVRPHDPLEILFNDDGTLLANASPSWSNPLGTTNLGRDIFSQLLVGARAALVVGVTAAIVVVAIGTLIGLVSGYFGGWIGSVLMRFADVALGIPFLPFVIVMSSFMGPSTWPIVMSIALLLWPNTARVIRAQVLIVRERAFVEAARVSGSSTWRILFVHVAPNILPLSFLYGSIAIGWAILTEASVSFLGFGPSDKVSWGYMLQDAYGSQALSRGSYNWFVPPGLCIVLVVVAGFFISRGYEELLFPKLKD
ncbi:ABC transporter permease [Terrarubrum flagellatum]|uniref:ABC transporter permease n=1 Tax=Terrirubrum flagellatum TaxID=2895980 RepID=UPI00314557D5